MYINSQLQKLQKIAEQLDHGIFDWSMFKSSSFDSAASQKRVHQLLQHTCIEESSQPVELQEVALDIVKSFCRMHLGVNLRKAFMQHTRKSG